MSSLVVLDYGVGNVGSVMNVLAKLHIAALRSSEPSAVDQAERLILPGVGTFDAGMTGLRDRGLVTPLIRAVEDRGIPILGICLGMHLFGAASEEGRETGLGLLDGAASLLRPDALPVPHMGWNSVVPVGEGGRFGGRYYFSHSYHFVCDADRVTAVTRYGIQIVAAVRCRNIVGVQFHPEKSQRDGMALLSEFAADGTTCSSPE